MDKWYVIVFFFGMHGKKGIKAAGFTFLGCFSSSILKSQNFGNFPSLNSPGVARLKSFRRLRIGNESSLEAKAECKNMQCCL